ALGGVRRRAEAVWQADQGVRGNSVQARRYGDASVGLACAVARGGGGEGSRPENRPIQLDGEADGQRNSYVGDDAGSADLRRLRLRQGLSRGAPYARCEGHGNL